MAQPPRRADDEDEDLMRALAESQVQDSYQTEEALFQSALAASARLEEEQERRREEETRRHDEEQRRSATVDPRERALAAAEARARAVVAPPPSVPLGGHTIFFSGPSGSPSALPPRSGAQTLSIQDNLPSSLPLSHLTVSFSRAPGGTVVKNSRWHTPSLFCAQDALALPPCLPR